MTTKTEIFWDDQDPNNTGWAFRMRQYDSNGRLFHEESGGINGSAADALDCINDGFEPNPNDLAILKRDFLSAEFSDKLDCQVGELFPGWDCA